MFTMAPPPVRLIARTAAWLAKKAARRFTAIASSQLSSVSSRKSRRWRNAALLISTSSRPRRPQTSSTMARGAPGAASCTATNSDETPSAESSSAAAAPASSSTSHTHTTAPSAPNARAMVLPMPRALPVTATTAPSKRRLALILGLAQGPQQLEFPREDLRRLEHPQQPLARRGERKGVPGAELGLHGLGVVVRILENRVRLPIEDGEVAWPAGHTHEEPALLDQPQIAAQIDAFVRGNDGVRQLANRVVHGLAANEHKRHGAAAAGSGEKLTPGGKVRVAAALLGRIVLEVQRDRHVRPGSPGQEHARPRRGFQLDAERPRRQAVPVQLLHDQRAAVRMSLGPPRPDGAVDNLQRRQGICHPAAGDAAQAGRRRRHGRPAHLRTTDEAHLHLGALHEKLLGQDQEPAEAGRRNPRVPYTGKT